MSKSSKTPIKPPNVAMVLPSNVLGGVEIGTLRLALALRDRGRYNPLAFVLDPQSSVGQLFTAEKIPTIPYRRVAPSYLHPAPYWSSVFELRRHFIQNQIALIHCQDMHPGLQAPLAGKLAGIPSICQVRCNYGNFLSRYKLPFACADRFAFVSRATWDNFNQIWNVRPGLGTVLYDWIPEPKLTRDRYEVRRQFSIPEDAFVVGMVARLSPPKDHATLLAACAELRQRVPHLWILLVGEAQSKEQHGELESKVQALDLMDRTIITGFREDVPDLLAAMDVHVLCTQREGFPLTVIEAMAVGTPVVATRVGGIPEIVEHGVTGLLHESGDVAALREALDSFASDPGLRATLAENAACSIRLKFGKEECLTKVEALYESLLGR
jgi:glycosyltransferase involved in cell wall biosynthesis